VLPDDKEAILRLVDEVNTGTPGAFDKLYSFAQEINTQDYKDAMAAISAGAKEHAVQNDAMWQALQAGKEAMQAASQGAVAAAGVAADGKKKQESYYVQQRPLSEGQVYMLFGRVERLDEGPFDAIKKGAAWVGKQATEKITSAKLLASWKLEGSPTDSEALAKFLKGQGVSDNIVTQVYGDMKLPAPGSQPAAADAPDLETVKQMVTKLPTDRKVRLLKYLQGGAKAGKAPADAEDNPNIVRGTESVNNTKGRLI
jgi:hypothetical protein